MDTQQPSLLVKIFGDTPFEAVVNSVLIAIILILLWRIAIKPSVTVAMNIYALIKANKLKLATLEIIPPKRSEISPASTTDLISILQQQLGKYDAISLEITGSKEAGIQYRIIADEQEIDSIQKHLASYLPELKFKRSSMEAVTTLNVFSVKQSRHFAYPLKPHEDLATTDPIAFIAGSMTQLKEDENVTLQLVMRRYSSRKAMRIYNQLLGKGKAKIDGKLRYYAMAYAWVWAPSLIIGLFTHSWQVGIAVALVLWVSSLFTEKEERELTQLEERMYAEIAAKLEQPLLQTDIRFAVYSPERSDKLVGDFMASLEPLNTTGFQYLALRKTYLNEWFQGYRNHIFTRRLSSIFSFNSSVMSASELAALFHFPHGVIKTESMVRSHSRTLPAPISMRSTDEFDIVIGTNKHHGLETPIGLTRSERERHMFVVGGTGSGKTTMLKYQIIQDIRNGKGLAVVDPHGDLAEELLEYIPKDRQKDLIYLNPDDLDHPIGVNLLELPEGLKGNDLLREKDRVTESVVSVMRKIFSEDDSGGHRIEYILRNTIQTALTLEKPTLFTIFRLLNDGKYAKAAIKNLEDEDLKAFWKNELGKAGSMQKVKMAAGITAKIGRFLFSASARAMLEQEKSTVSFDEILDGKILICNFSKGRLGEDTSMLFGITILAKLQLAALKRSEKKQADRKPFYLYVDEFQNFATLSFTQMLSEARKYKVFLTMAEQSTQQQDDQKMVNIILANVGTVVVFRTGSPKDEELLLPLFEPYIEKGEISNLSAYNFYCRITSVDAQEPMSGETIVF
jgi:hypothetical protein